MCLVYVRSVTSVPKDDCRKAGLAHCHVSKSLLWVEKEFGGDMAAAMGVCIVVHSAGGPLLVGAAGGKCPDS